MDSVALSSDGHTIYACSHSGSSAADITQTIAAYDTTTGQPSRVLRTWHPQDLSCAITADPAGGYLLLASARGKATGSAPPKHYVTNSKGRMTLSRGAHPSRVLTWMDLSTGGTTTVPLSIPSGTSLAL